MLDTAADCALTNFLSAPLSSGTSTIQRCRLVFRSLLSPAVEELCQTANSLIAPVRMGVARPTAPFQLAQTGQEALQGSEELFAVEPIVATVAGGAAGAAIPVIGLPGCARSLALNGADWVMERVICDVPLSPADIMGMGVGGLLKDIPQRGLPREP